VKKLSYFVMAKFNPPAEFDFQKPTEWTAWRRRFERYADITKLDKEEGKIQVSTLLYTMGHQAEHIFTSFGLSAEDATKLPTVLDKFDSHFQPKTNLIHERALFYSRNQSEGETVERFVLALHEMVEKCKFDEGLKEEQLRDRLVVGLRDKTASHDLQLKENLTFQQAVTFARQAEAVREQMGIQCPKTSSSTPSAVEETKKQRKSNFKKRKPPLQPQGAEGVTKCKYCGGAHALDRNKCPARTAVCNNCSKTGHYAKCAEKQLTSLKPN
jgi:hypothetical protein